MASPVEHGSQSLPSGWVYERVGTVLMRTKPITPLPFDELVEQNVHACLELGDERTLADLDTHLRAELELRVSEYGKQATLIPR
ncbi:hypothetical protein [Lentzea aerocolonigenes]|uniref:hypothetical protein n=1 Tax=Lentzea aerocolonigenes TaxID=68170 RepID=UPI0004C3E6D6|nr:hypothetical protein [Lentzea aerocolonigenes]MCP2242706.1 hypothetical protein [Lentzea aerocolonigenes]